MAKHYDVAVLGAGIGALSAAALLARRSWRVLVLGQGWRPSTYTFDGVTLARRPFTFLAGSSPAWARVIVELAQSQSFRRYAEPLDPMFQVLAHRLRLDVPPDLQLFAREIDRSFPEVRRVVDVLYAELARTNAAADAAFERDAAWPPGTFWEKRETARLAATLPRLAGTVGPSLMAEFPREHPYRSIVEVPARFASHAVDLPELAIARLHGAWTRGVSRIVHGEQALVDFLVDRVRAHGGETLLTERAVRIEQRRGRATGVLVDGDEDVTGVGFVLTDHPARALVDLTADFDPPRAALAGLPHLVPAESRFVLSIVVRDEGLPVPLGAESFLLPDGPPQPGASGRPTRGGEGPDGGWTPLVHLQRVAEPCGLPGATLLVAEALFPESAAFPVKRAREAVLRVVEGRLPFLGAHTLLVDSPHDGRPLWDYRSGARKAVNRAALRATGGSPEAELMTPRWRVEPPSFYGLAGEPIRAPLGGAFVVGPSVLPALGQEGELLAAWSAARMITKTDRRRERMRRSMWSKIELG